MVGMIHRVLLELIERTAGKDAVARVREQAGIPADKEFAIHVTYGDEEWRRLFDATRAVLGLTVEQAEEAFADAFIEDALRRWPEWFKMSRNSREFLQRQPAIHNSVSAGVRDTLARKSIVDKFRVERDADDLVVHYRSDNRHCGLYQALARKLFAHYGDEATIEESACMRAGAAACVLRVHWTRLGATP
jgi:hypothetical protein